MSKVKSTLLIDDAEFIATVIALIERQQPVQVFGKFCTIRGYLEIGDLVQGILAAMNSGQTGQIYKIGSGVGRSNLDILNILVPIASKSGHTVQIESLPARPFDVAINVLDSSKLEKISGWKPQIEFEDGLGRLVNSVLSGKSK